MFEVSLLPGGGARGAKATKGAGVEFSTQEFTSTARKDGRWWVVLDPAMTLTPAAQLLIGPAMSGRFPARR
jgi:hypothetical protein